MDHDMFSCNLKSSFLDDLSDFSQETSTCKYPQPNRTSNTNSYPRDMYTTQSSMNYYNESQPNYPRQNVYSYNYPNYDFNASGPGVSYLPSNYDPNYQNYAKYCSLPRQIYRNQEMVDPLCQSPYQYPPAASQYFHNGGQSMYYEQGVPQYDVDRNKMERVVMQNLASIDQNIYICEAKLHALSQGPSNSASYVHEVNEVKEKLLYCQQVKEKYLAGSRKENVVSKPPINNYGLPMRRDVYNPCQQGSVSSSQYYDGVGTFNKQGESSYGYYQYPGVQNNNPSQSVPATIDSKGSSMAHLWQETIPSFSGDCVSHKSFVSDLIEPDASYSCYEDTKPNEATTVVDNCRDELSTPPICDFTDLTSAMKASPSKFTRPIGTIDNASMPGVVTTVAEPIQDHLEDSIKVDDQIKVEDQIKLEDQVKVEDVVNEVTPPPVVAEDMEDDNHQDNPPSHHSNRSRESGEDIITTPTAADDSDPTRTECDDVEDDDDMDDSESMQVTTLTPCSVALVIMPANQYQDLGHTSPNVPTIEKRVKVQFRSINPSKWSFRCKQYYFRLKIKKMANIVSLRKKSTNRKVILNSKSDETEPNNVVNSKSKPGAKRPKKTSKRIKEAESFLKRKVTRGSYFNNSDNEDMNISRKSLRNSTKSEMKTRTKKGINFEEDSIDDSSTSSDCDVNSTFELRLDNRDTKRTIHKILGARVIKAVDLGECESDRDIEEYYLKYRGLSYIHCEWKSTDTIDDPTFPSKLKRYKNAKMNSVDEAEDCLFNPDYVEIERVLDVKEIEIEHKEVVTYYLVKWRSLSYEEITWEKSEDVDPSKVKEYLQRNEDSYVENAEIPKPTHIDWTPISSDVIYKNVNCLRDYQLEGVNWLTFCWITNRNCILADEMGLGKTIQSIAFLIELYNYQFKGPFLVIVPLSTLGNWQREFEQWSDLNVIVYHGSARGRSIVQNYETYSKTSDSSQPKQLLFNALVTTYEVLISDLLYLSKFQWTAAIIDEAHRLKNKRCKLFEGLKILDLQFRVLLTGTPLQNNVQELYNLLNFLEPSKFVSESAFLAQYGDLRSEEQVASLKLLLKPMMLRRLKEDVEKGLAPKEEIVVEVELTNIQKKYYRAILERNFGFLSKGISGSNVPNLMNTMMELRKCCNHPFLIKGAEDSILNNIKNGSDMGNITKFIQNKIVDEETLQFYSMVYASGKLVLIHKLLSKLKQDGHKVLIFSQMVRVLDILEDYLIYEKYQYERIDGRIYGLLRQEAIDRFSNDPEKFVFLLCTKAGGLGINLTAADVVIIYDSDWNPQNDLQAQARCHRIGQQKLVNVYRLITRNTYEREMFDRASLKLGLDKAILQSMSYTESKPTSQLSKKEIEDLLKLGAYGALLDDDKDGEKFCEEDIEKILLSRSTVVKLNNLERNSSFSKASFSISDNRVDICLDDPNFWQKWAKKAGVDEKEICNTLIMDKPRLRRQTNRYKPNSTLYDDISGDDSNSSFIDSTKSRFANVKMIPNNITKLKKKSNKSGSGESIDENKEECFSEEVQFKATPDMDRYDLFKAEKCLLQFGWGRWEHAIEKITFKTPMNLPELKSLCRIILLYAHRYYNGDDRIHSFIEDLLQPDADAAVMRKHVGYSAPVARGRRGRKGTDEIISLSKKEPHLPDNKNLNKKMTDDINALDEEQSDILTNISTPLSENGDTSDNDSEFTVLVCPNFRKHIQRTSHKLLHRIQFLYFLHHDIIGPDRAKMILSNTNYLEIPGFSELKLFAYLDNDYLPFWWNRTVDKSLLLGIFKHGWEKYDEIFKDPSLGFVEWLSGSSYPENDGFSKNHKLKSNKTKGKDESINSKQIDRERKDEFPTNTELNIRLRKIIGSFQKLWRQRENEKTKLRALGHPSENSLQTTDSINNNDTKTSKWSRREETEFYRAINSYGIEKRTDSDEFIWTNFRNVCNLPRKSNDSLTEYFKAFYTMCQKVCQKYPLIYPENHALEVDNISSERACRCLVKINLISKIRNDILSLPDLDERILLCQSTNDFPSWWIPGFHDLSLLKGISRYGANRTELSIISDPSLGFHKSILDILSKEVSETNKDQCELLIKCEPEGDNDKPIKIEETTEIPNDVINEELKEELTDPLISQVEHRLLDCVYDEIISELCNVKLEKVSFINKDVPMSSLDKVSVTNPFDVSLLSKIGWPKERVLLSRLELIVQTVEKGVWPFTKTQNTGISKTISETLDQFTDSIKSSCKEEVNVVSKVVDNIKTEPQDSVFKTKRRGRKRAAVHLMLSKELDGVDKHGCFTATNEGAIPEENEVRAAYESWSAALMSAALSSSLSSDPALFMQKMLQMSPDLSSNLDKSSITSTQMNNSASGVDLTNGTINMNSSTDAGIMDPSMWSMQPQLSSKLSSKQNIRRGRRPKHVRSFEISKESKPECSSVSNMINNYSTNPIMCGDAANNNPDIIIPVINIFDGTIIYDESAPKRKNLECYLIKNPNFMPYSVEEDDQKIFRKVAKSRGQDTSTLDSLIFTQYMGFLMNTMMASQTPFNNTALSAAASSSYNNVPATSDLEKTGQSCIDEQQLSAASLYMHYLSMMTAANQATSGGSESRPSIVSNEDQIKPKKRAHSPVSVNRQATPAKVKSYSISHLTESVKTSSDENRIPAHSKPDHITIGRHLNPESSQASATSNFHSLLDITSANNTTNNKFTADHPAMSLCNAKSALSEPACTSSFKCNPATAAANHDFLGAYQAYLYSAMMYSDYVAYMQQYASLSNSTNKCVNNSPSSTNLDLFTNNTMKLPPSQHDTASMAATASSFFNDSLSSAKSAIFDCASATTPIIINTNNGSSSKRKKTYPSSCKVTNFSVESMGIAVTSTSSSSMLSASSSLSMCLPMIENSGGISHRASITHINNDGDGDECAVLDLSSR